MTDATTTPPRPWKDRLAFAALLLLVGFAAGALLVAVFPEWLPGGAERVALRKAPSVAIAHIADPVISGQADANATALREALRELRARPGVEQPVAVVISGRLLADAPATAAAPTPAGDTAAAAAATPDTAAAEQTAPPADPAETAETAETAAADAFGTLLASGPVAEVYLVPDVPLPAALIDRVAEAARQAGVEVYDLTACYDTARAGTESAASCRGDLIGTPWSVVGLAARSAATGDSSRISSRFSAIVSASTDARRKLVLVSGAFTAGDTVVNGVLRRAQGRVVALLTGSRADPSISTFTPGTTVVTPSLGRAGGANSRQGITMLRLGPAGTAHSLVVYDHRAERFIRPVATTEEPGKGRRWWDRILSIGDPLGEPARSAIYWLAVLTAFLTVAALWEVPPPRSEGDAEAAAAEDRGVFKSNLGRTVLSGLTGIAAVTVLGEIWGMSGTSGQAFFVIAFVQWLLVLLLVIAFVRAAIELLRHRVVAEYRPPVTYGERKQRFWAWIFSLRPSLVIFADTFTNVLLGRSWVRSGVWEVPLVRVQQSLLDTIDRVREGISEAVAQALKEVGGGTHDQTFRVNISLLSSDATQAFYVSAARGAADKIFNRQSIAHLVIVSGEARWWKRSYGGPHNAGDPHRHLRSAATLGARSGERLLRTTRLTDLEIKHGDRTSSPAGGEPMVAVKGRFGDATPIPGAPVRLTGETIGDLLATLNGPKILGAGSRPAFASIDPRGHLLVADLEGDPSELTIDGLCVGGVDLGPFALVTFSAVDLFPAPPPPRFDGHVDRISLNTHFETRGSIDYEAFVVLPLPWNARGDQGEKRRAGIHISFRSAAAMDAIWSGLETADTNGNARPAYEIQNQLLSSAMLQHAPLRAVLRQAVGILDAAIQEFNETWYRAGGAQRRN